MSMSALAHGVLSTYRGKEPNAHYNAGLGFLTSICVGGPLAIGQLSNRQVDGGTAALAAWFIALMVTPRTAGRRAFELGRRVLITTAATALGAIIGDNMWGASAVLAVLALLIPVPGMTITPLICLIMGQRTPPGMSSAEHVIAFAAGAAWAFLVLMHPASAVPSRKNTPTIYQRSVREVILGHLLTPGAKRNYATQVAVVIPILNNVLTTCHWPHAGWVLIGVLTTLRPNWTAIHARVIKRSIGMAGGSLMTALALWITHISSTWVAIVIMTVLAALARPFRQFNYGYWPIFGTPVLLLLVNLSEALEISDCVWRLCNNLLGAACTLATVSLLWPHPEQQHRLHRPNS